MVKDMARSAIGGQLVLFFSRCTYPFHFLDVVFRLKSCFFFRLAGYPVFYSSSQSGSASTYRKILNWEETLEAAFKETDISPCAKDLISRFLTHRENRIGAKGGIEEIQRHPFFEGMLQVVTCPMTANLTNSFLGIDWENIRNMPAPIVPHIEHPTDTSNFPLDDQDAESTSEDEEESEIESKYPLYRGRRLRKTDIPFIGFTYKNLAAVPQLIRSPPQK